jgi:hypothetical protein
VIAVLLMVVVTDKAVSILDSDSDFFNMKKGTPTYLYENSVRAIDDYKHNDISQSVRDRANKYACKSTF